MIPSAYLLGNVAALIVKGSKTEKLQYDRSYTEAAVLWDIPAFICSKPMMPCLRTLYNFICSIRGQACRMVLLHLVNYENKNVILDAVMLTFCRLVFKISQKLYEPYIEEVFLFKGCSLGFIKQFATRIHEEF
ncbi:unnamed protein product [Prunus armeniaca]